MEPIIRAMQAAITQLNHNNTTLTADVAVLKSQVNEIMWAQRAVLVVVIGFIVGRILLRTFNNRKNNK